MTTALLEKPPTANPFQPSQPPAPPPAPSPITRFVRGKETDPVWVRPALLTLLAVTAGLYLWGLGASGWANSYYSAAVQAGTKSWKAFFYGSSDAGSSITVDKSPLFLWPMEISARIFGVNSWSILVPQALEGVAAVGVLYAAVRRWFTPAAGLLAGAVLAATPVAALMFRFNNPDALLTLLLTVAAYAMVRALESGATKWMVLSGSLVGLGFLSKMLQALLVVPGFALVYLIAGPPALGKRVKQVLLAGVAMVAAGGWWVAIVQLTPKSARPYIGGSQNNSLLNLIFGYNGFGRLTGSETGSVGGGGGNGGRWGPTGLTRLFNSQFGGEISWLIPAALVFLAAGLLLGWRAHRTARMRSAMLLWGGWLVITGLAISLGQGIIHPYYTVALAPAVGAVVGIGATMLWQRRNLLVARAVLATAMGVTAYWSYRLLLRTPTWHPALRAFVLLAGLAAAVAIVAVPRLTGMSARAVAATALVAGLAGPLAYTLATVTTPHDGAIPSSGPAGVGLGFGPGGPGGGRGGAGGANFGPPPGITRGALGRGGFAGGGGPGGGGGGGGILNSSRPSTELVSTLKANSGAYTWVAATVSANQAAGYQLATGDAVRPLGGFNGTDPSPTLTQFQQWVAQGKVHYFIAAGNGGGGFGGGFGGGPGGPGGGSASSSSITSWVESNFSSTTVGGVTLYDLTTATAAS